MDCTIEESAAFEDLQGVIEALIIEGLPELIEEHNGKEGTQKILGLKNTRPFERNLPNPSYKMELADIIKDRTNLAFDSFKIKYHLFINLNPIDTQYKAKLGTYFLIIQKLLQNHKYASHWHKLQTKGMTENKIGIEVWV